MKATVDIFLVGLKLATLGCFSLRGWNAENGEMYNLSCLFWISSHDRFPPNGGLAGRPLISGKTRYVSVGDAKRRGRRGRSRACIASRPNGTDRRFETSRAAGSSDSSAQMETEARQLHRVGWLEPLRKCPEGTVCVERVQKRNRTQLGTLSGSRLQEERSEENYVRREWTNGASNSNGGNRNCGMPWLRQVGGSWWPGAADR